MFCIHVCIYKRCDVCVCVLACAREGDPFAHTLLLMAYESVQRLSDWFTTIPQNAHLANIKKSPQKNPKRKKIGDS